jgi:hypothetical protein
VATPPDSCNLFITFKAAQRCNLACTTDLVRRVRVKKGPVGEQLKITIGVVMKDFGQLLVHQGFSAKDPKKVGSLSFPGLNYSLYFFQRHIFFASVCRNPASLASEIAVVGNRDKLKGRKQQPFLTTPPEAEKTLPTAPDHIDQEFAAAFRVSFYIIAVYRHALNF